MSSVLPAPHLCFKVEDNIFQFSVKMVDAEFEEGVVSCYIILHAIFPFFLFFKLLNPPFIIYNNFYFSFFPNCPLEVQ
jgi:hypothetical protein